MGVGGQRHVLVAIPAGKTRYQLYKRLDGPHGRSGKVWKISPPPGFDPRTVQPVASRYTDWAILALRIYLWQNNNNNNNNNLLIIYKYKQYKFYAKYWIWYYNHVSTTPARDLTNEATSLCCCITNCRYQNMNLAAHSFASQVNKAGQQTLWAPLGAACYLAHAQATPNILLYVQKHSCYRNCSFGLRIKSVYKVSA